MFASELNGPSFAYIFDVSSYPAGSIFDVTLWMAEIFFENAGERKFNVTMEAGATERNNLDLIQDIGGIFIAKAYTFEVTVEDGELNIEFAADIDNAKVSGIEVLYDASKQP